MNLSVQLISLVIDRPLILSGCTCHHTLQAFPPGQHFTVPALPDIDAVNKLGGLNIAADRLAIIDGEGTPFTRLTLLRTNGLLLEDPWRPNTPHSDDAQPRPDTTIRPFKQISGASSSRHNIASSAHPAIRVFLVACRMWIRCRPPLGRERFERSYGRATYN